MLAVVVLAVAVPPPHAASGASAAIVAPDPSMRKKSRRFGDQRLTSSAEGVTSCCADWFDSAILLMSVSPLKDLR